MAIVSRRRGWILAALAIPGILGAAVLGNLAACAVLRARYPAPGEIYQVNGHAMHIYCAGQGSPAVILEGGRGDDWMYWQKVQPELAKTTRVCSYDRAGLGWSDVQPGARDATNTVAQLHALLQTARVNGPLVLVGASMGGLYVRQYVATYPQEVAGIVFADSSTPEQVEALGSQDSEALRKQRHHDATIQWLKETSGWARISGQCKGEVEPGLEAYADLARAEACRPAFSTSWLGEWDDFWISAQQAGAAHCCHDLPLVIISQDPNRPKPGWNAQAIAAQPIWFGLQEKLKDLSTRSRRVVARNSGHHVMTDRPDVVIAGIREVLNEVRGAKIEASRYGVTVVQ